MTDTLFRKRIRLSLADESLQAALDANAERRLKGRESAFASLGDWKDRRRRAHEVRADVIAHLDQYLADFTEKATQNGVSVHWAADDAQAINLVLSIAQSLSGSVKGPPDSREAASPQVSISKLIAKSKSMVSEEIELNRALEARGHRVVETDLGEYIVQLRGEKPAHIITPAVHLRRHQVGELFHEQLGLPYTEDIPTLTAAARKVLRDVFLRADVGVSGVNFGVAETGTLCVVTNEGNGRMVTTVPPIHIALLGMERLVPTLEDLALMLSLLPRSATGQKLSAYTQLLHGPRRADEIDGASERHVIIVDNGRSRIRDSRLREALYCIRCGACLNACPVFREIGGHAYVGADGSMAPYPGPIGSIVSPGLLGLQAFGHLAQASSLCGACKDVCPVDIDLPRLLTTVRAGQEKKPRSSEGVGLPMLSRAGLRAYNAVASSPRLFELSQSAAGIAARIISPFSTWMWLPGWTGWGYSKALPRPALKPFRARFRIKDFPIEMGSAGAAPSLTASTAAQERLSDRPYSRIPGQKLDAAMPESAPIDLVQRFIQELEALGARAYRTSGSALPALLLGILREHSIDSVLAWDAIEPVDLTRLPEAGIDLVRTVDPTLRAGITAAFSGVAQTGTLVLTSGAGQPLTASLLPEIHIAVIRSSQIVWSLEQALQAPKIAQASAVVLISGPSRTADIEMTLTIGVHGPAELHVLIVEERP